MDPLTCQTQGEFDQICSRLERFADNSSGHERIRLDNNEKPINTYPKACWLSRVIQWIKRIFSCNRIHPAVRVAEKMLSFFEANAKFILPKHALAISSIRKIKKANVPNIDIRYAFLKSVAGDATRFAYAARKEIHQEIADLITEKVRHQRAYGNQVVAAQNRSEDLIAEAKRKSAQIVSAARDTASNMIKRAERTIAEKADGMEKEESYIRRRLKGLEDQIPDIENHCLVLNSCTDQQTRLQLAEANQFYEKMVKKANDDSNKMRSEAAEKILETKNRAQYEANIEIGLLKESAAKEIEDIGEKGKKEAEELRLKSTSQLKALSENIDDMRRRVKEASEARDQLIEGTKLRCKEMLDKQAQHCQELKAEAEEKIAAKEKTASEGIEKLNEVIKGLEAQVKTLESQQKAVSDAPVTIICRNGEIPNVPYLTLSGIPFLSSRLSWREKTSAAAAAAVLPPTKEADNKQADSKEKNSTVKNAEGSAATAVPSKASEKSVALSLEPTSEQDLEVDFAEEMLKTKSMVVDLKAYHIDTVKLLLESLQNKFPPSQKSETMVELFILAETMGFLDFYGQGKNHEVVAECIKYFGNKFFQITENCSFILKLLTQGNLPVPLQTVFLKRISSYLSNFARMDEICKLNHEMFLRILKDGKHRLTPTELYSLNIRWLAVAGEGQVDRHGGLLYKIIDDTSLWELCFSQESDTRKGEVISELTDQTKFSAALAREIKSCAEAKEKKAKLEKQTEVTLQQGQAVKYRIKWSNMHLICSLDGIPTVPEQLHYKDIVHNGKPYRVILRAEMSNGHSDSIFYIYVESRHDLKEWKADFQIDNCREWTFEQLVNTLGHKYLIAGYKVDNVFRRSNNFAIRAEFRFGKEILNFIRNDTLEFSITIRD